MAIRRRLAVQRPDANLPGLAHSLHNFSLDLIATEKEVEASKVLDESIPLYLRLTLDKGSSYLPYLANALNSKAVQSRDGTKLREAAIASARSVVIYMQLARERPSDFQADLAVALRNHRWALLDAGLVKPAKWDTVLREASEMTQRELPRKAQPPKGQTLKEDEEIRKLANEVVSVNAVDLGEAWAQANATLERHRIRISISEMGSSPPRDFAKRIRPVWLTPRRWLRRGHLGQKRQWADTTKGMLTPKSVIKRASLVFRYRASKFSDRQEDPRETLDYLYQQQLEALTRIRGGATNLATARRLVEMELEHLRHQAKLQGQAMRTQELDTEDIAARKEMQDQIAELESQYRALRADEAKVTTLSQRVQTKVNAFRTLNQVFKATYTATDAQREIGLMLYGLSKETSISGMTMQRAQDRNTHMQARAGMVNELIIPGTFDDVNGPPSEYIQPVLDRVDADIDAELKRPKGKINGDPASATDARIGDSKSASATDQPQTGNAHDRPNSE